MRRSDRVRELRRKLDEARDGIEVPCGSFPEKWFNQQSTKDTREARQLCNTRCDVREQCLAYALAAGERYGVWGGESSPDGSTLRSRVATDSISA